MARNITFENKDFLVIPDEDKKFTIYVLEDFKAGNYKEFYIKQTGIYFFLNISTVKLPNGFWAYGFQSNILELSNQKVHGTEINDFKTELDALQNCLKNFYNYGISNYKYGFHILEMFEKYVYPKSLFDTVAD
ncbi:hypothetical protein J2Q11_12370 [Tenacibaculum finnmarkense genomovar finnmarkense]|uniref:hypothetical protein n=1 Tax=Tenacibaculum finnmarkense TaxID=2781243 RepID=UPI001EFA533F|nr:hypothetical protein [Tenacibaculum finnmarkense]MCG8213580.1 hypothetical protein [Tenacibaculum finnmarkense genomovar finnmarkense]MCG8231925.1 hypothetical protein [Tenacibaculum finnmarkense genomovar finnmarkense]MCG8886461.1 hypothetical protein [Tenacibaculum finnmarkense]MCG8897243.1 hypothetical protein [Tenacibaculum finnmarkense]MCG8903979.1 hypothetical protein [Tenacibaculum finnmarkense]